MNSQDRNTNITQKVQQALNNIANKKESRRNSDSIHLGGNINGNRRLPKFLAGKVPGGMNYANMRGE